MQVGKIEQLTTPPGRFPVSGYRHMMRRPQVAVNIGELTATIRFNNPPGLIDAATKLTEAHKVFEVAYHEFLEILAQNVDLVKDEGKPNGAD